MEDTTIPPNNSEAHLPSPANDSKEDELSPLTTLSLLTITDESKDIDVGIAEDAGDVAVESEERENEESKEEDEVEEKVEEDRETNNNSDSTNSNSNNSKWSRYPVRPDAEVCAFYMKTGMCKFGLNCKFNHPPLCKFSQGGKVKRKEPFDTASENVVKEKDDSVEKEGWADCKYLDRPGGCKFGKACKFNHNKKTFPVELNFMGLPIRQGEKECPYYIRNGSCKFGASCRFNHPDPTSVGRLDALPSYSNKGSMSSPSASQPTLKSWSPPAALNKNPAYMPMMFPPTQGVLPRPEWTAYQTPAYQLGTIHMAPTYAMNRQPSERNVYSHQREQILVDEYPERPGQPECSYFLKTGNCKYKSACKFHHPRNASEKSSAYSLSELGLPLRPGESMCSYYSRYGICKYGPACKYDHPVNHAHSAVGLSMTPGLVNSMVSSHAMAAGS